MAVEVSHIRRLVQGRLAEVKRVAAARRERIALAEREFAVFLPSMALPVFNAIAQALSAEGHPYRVTTPGGGVRMGSERSARNFVDLRLDTSTAEPNVVVEFSRERGHRVLVDERVLGSGKPVSALTEEDVVEFLVNAVGELVER
ncbi:MAG: hypothetical protein Q7V01_12875 [Vicinamibacterales bacterium]|nr:hypothetical protein [Vicinamibacterales bacterium]